MSNVKIFKMKSILLLYNYDFNALNYQDFHFGISSFVYIRTIFNDIFAVNPKYNTIHYWKGMNYYSSIEGKKGRRYL